MWADKIIKQNSPHNILWRLFRIEVEKQNRPAEMSGGVRKLLRDVGKRNRLKTPEKGGESDDE